MPKVSVVLATYNGEKFLEEQLSSLLMGTRKPDEVIICDDCSCDGTAEVVTEFLEKHQPENWCFLRCDKNVGFIENFHRALSRATGDIIFLCDQDDVWEKDKIEAMCSFFRLHRDALAVCTALNPIDENGQPKLMPKKRGTENCSLVKRRVGRNNFIKISLPECLRCNPSAGCTMAVKRELLGEYIVLSKRQMPHDHELNLLAAMKNSLYFWNKPFTRYRLHGGNALGFKSRGQTRAEIAKEKLLFAEALLPYEADFFGMLSLRAEALEGRDISKLRRLRFSKPNREKYKKFFTLRERMGDLVYCMR